MRNVLKILMAGALTACAVFAQDKSESVEGIVKELGGYKAAPAAVAPAVVAETPAVEAKPVAVTESKGWKFWHKADKKPVVAAKEEPAAVAAPVAAAPAAVEAVKEAPAANPAEVKAMVEESRDLYVGGEFERAQRGFEAVIKKDPENLIARMYLRKLLERDARKTEISAMKNVTGAWKTDLVLRSYPISAEAAEKMELKNATKSMDVTGKFPEVKFPKGASAVYQPKLEKLFVRNTCENLAVIEEILVAMDVSKVSSDVAQVEIEAKFIEVSEGTLEQLGFEWRSIVGQPISTVGGVNIPSGQYLFDDALRGGPGNATPGLPFNNAAGQGVTGASGDWTAFRMEDTFSTSPANMTVHKGGSTPLDILISALDQSSGADMLSAPRVVTKSGKKATIRVGQLHYYPDVYEASANGGTIVNVRYTDWKERLLGVELDVTPQVDGDQIGLGLNPKLLELEGMQSYDIAPKDSAYNTYQYRIGNAYQHDAITAQLPIFRKREIKTEVTIADGATIGMGGLINEKVESYEDKVPVLGSIPLIGRLFRNEGERAVKRNLMIFVTAKKVTPSGRINTARSFE
jgi:type II secretory pathway component GspD/PulD (secretin)